MNNSYKELYHHGVMGMKWGVRRYQNEDGTLTPLGQKKIKKLKNQFVNTATKNRASFTNERNKIYKKYSKDINSYLNSESKRKIRNGEKRMNEMSKELDFAKQQHLKTTSFYGQKFLKKYKSITGNSTEGELFIEQLFHQLYD